ncbi:class I SAM-dependent methyltransferase [Sphingobium sp.]|uniref:class I SAM-dependent methyltransferase n=1 Tax=Sphingobium sp. TaxID=1912891 RepID=UPI002CFF0C20|nr:class I SAM-dependent methyltransferase [Sphingobium sp.]HUD93666.1 class I SAM-dependent methyltransferase [Sphingobium sp.]
MIENLERLELLLRCPTTGKPLVRTEAGYETAGDSPLVYPVLDGKPVLVDFATSVLSPDVLHSSAASSPIERPKLEFGRSLFKRMLSPEKKSTRENIAKLLEGLPPQRSSSVLVIGGGTIGQGTDALYDCPMARVIALDIYQTANTHLIADAHHIPLCDDAVDAVVIQAVLEHVIDPQAVVDEIWRVLRPGGMVYAETPFLQHVHEGPYDFMRFTESGHRYLFRKFALVGSGVSGGPGTQLLWSIDYFFKSLFRSRRIGKIFKMAFSWLQWLDPLIRSDYGSDAASGTFFLGRKSNRTISPREIVEFYRGAQVAGG